MTQARLLGGRYQVGELLGYGGMAEVHRGRDLRLGRDVAIKLLRTDLARDDTFQLRFRREAQNAASLNHPAIVAVYDTGEERAATGEALPYIVMEFVNGRTLKEVLAAEGRLLPRRALDLTAEICGALEFSHRHGIIHRDIKPGNVMLTQAGQVKVMDFGIARALASGAATMTQTSAVIGTAQYLSPEQARGEAVDARSDVYATGCVLYELLCGHPPFVGDSPVSVAYQHVREDPKAPSESNRDVSPVIDSVVLKALAKNPVNRYQTRQIPARVGDSRRRRTSGWAIAALTALAVLAVVALTAGLIVASQPKKATVPNLVGQTKARADSLLRGADLVPDPQLRSGTDCTVNMVESQDPSANTRVNTKSKVRYTYCGGPGKTQVPPVLNLSKENAQAQLAAAKLTWKIEAADSEKPAGTVVDVTPPVGTAVNEGSEVLLKVSKGNLKIVPNVSGLSEDAAKAVLANAGFKNVEAVPRTTTDPSLNGKVIDQDPGPNLPRAPTAKIRIFVGDFTEPPPTESPSPSPTG
jgi:serine/threonine protein kinase